MIWCKDVALPMALLGFERHPIEKKIQWWVLCYQQHSQASAFRYRKLGVSPRRKIQVNDALNAETAT